MQEKHTAQPANDVSPHTIAAKILAMDIGEKTVLINFNGGFLSSDAGAFLLREVEEQIGLIRKMADVIPDSRDARYITHKITELLIQRVAQIACGYEDANDCDTLRHDPIFKMIAGRYPECGEALASQPTMSRFEHSITRTTLYRLARVFADIFIASYEEPPELIILDVDDTDDPVYGHQQLSLFNTCDKERCYLPLHVYEALSGTLMTTILKPGKRCTGHQMLSIVKRLIGHLRAAWPKTVILFRGDSHFAYPEVMDGLEAQNNVHYLTGLTGNSRKGLNLRFVVTDIRGGSAAQIYTEFYCARGEAELYINDHKRSLKSDRTSCTEFEANQFRVFLHSAAYVLLHTLKTTLLKQTEFATATINTIQLRLLKIGARIRECKTRIVVELPSQYPLKELLLRGFQICTLLRST